MLFFFFSCSELLGSLFHVLLCGVARMPSLARLWDGGLKAVAVWEWEVLRLAFLLSCLFFRLKRGLSGTRRREGFTGGVRCPFYFVWSDSYLFGVFIS